MNSNETAEFKKRFLALLLDFLIIVCYAMVLFAVILLIYFVILDGIPDFNELGMNLASISLIIPVLLYSIIMETSKQHATWGKRKMKIKVASVMSAQVQPWQIIVRNIIKLLPWQLAHMAIFHAFALQWELTPLWTGALIAANMLPLLWIGFLFRKDHRGPHDLIAGTVVIANLSNRIHPV